MIPTVLYRFKVNGSKVKSQHDITYQHKNSGTDKLSKFKLGEDHPKAERNTSQHMFKVIGSNSEIGITPQWIARLHSDLVLHVTGDTLQMSRSSSKAQGHNANVTYTVSGAKAL